MDANLELRAASAGNLTGDATLTAVPLTPMDKPLYLHLQKFWHNSIIEISTLSWVILLKEECWVAMSVELK